MSIIAADAPIACAEYAKKHNLLEKPGWKRFKRIAKQLDKMFDLNKVKIRQHQCKLRHKYGVEIPRDYADAVRIDKENSNSLWQDATSLEMDLMLKYSMFRDTGKQAPVPKGYKNIRVHKT